MRPIPTALALAAAPLLLLAAPADACSVTADYRQPTNLELAAEANAIVLGEVVGAAEAASEPGEALSAAIEVRPIAALKGLMPGGSFVVPGMSLVAAGGAAGDPLDFARPHPDALAGACIRRTFPAGATVLFFLRRENGAWAPAGGPFSRWAEDVPPGPAGPDAVAGDPWVQLATLYAHAAQLPADERAALLADQLEALQARIDAEASLPRTRSGDPATLAIATDIERAMAAPGFPQLAVRAPPPAPPAPAEVAHEGGDIATVQQALDALDAGGP